MDTKTQLDRLTELTILHRSQLRELASQLPGLREEVVAEFERRMDEAEPQFREELEAFAQARTEHEVAELSAKLKSEIDSVSEAAQKRVTDKIGLIVAEKKAVRELMKKAQAEIKGALKTVPGQIKTVVGLEAESIREETKKQLDTHFAVPRTINPRGVWKKNTVYEPLDLVSDNGSSYIANVRNRDVKPGMGKDEWTLIARRGGGGGSPITSLSELVGPPTDGQILIGDNGNYVNANLSAGYGINITEGAGSIEISTSGFVVFKGAWNAATNTPALASGVGTAGNYYVVATAGSTNLDGITDWQAGDWAIFNGTAWEKVDNSEIITSVNGQTGVVVITKSDVGLGNVTNDAQLKIASDLSDLSDAPTARSNLGLGDSATLDVGTTSGTVAAGDDSRLSDARTPTAHAESHVDGTDDIRDATASLKGLATAAQIAKLDGIDAGANVGITELTGDVTAGPGGDSQAATLASTGVAAASYGSATQVGTFTVDAKGRLTAASDVTITPAFASITSKPTTLSGYGITDGVNTSQLGAANGVATLDSGSKLTSSQLPDIAVTEYLGDSANEAAMLALTGEQGDWTTRTDLGTVWIITGSDPSVIGGWTQLSYPTAPVTSVATKTGAVTLDSSDVGLGNVDNTSDENKPVSTAQQTALDLKANLISPTLVTPALGTPSSGVVTNLTGTASININGTVGATTPSTGAFTTLSASTNVNAGGNNLSLTNTNAGSSAQATIRFINDTAEQGNISLNSSTYSFGTLVANAIGIRSYTAAGVYLTAENASGHIRLGIGATPSTIADFSSTGLAVTGAVSSDSLVKIGGTVNGGSGLQFDVSRSLSGVEWFGSASGAGYGHRAIEDDSGAGFSRFKLQGRVNSASWTTVLQVDGTAGLAVTGALSATTTLQAKTGTTNPPSSGALTGLSMGFDSNTEVSWIQSERNSLAETRSLLLNPNGGFVGVGTASPLNKLQINTSVGASVPAAGSSGHTFAAGSSAFGLTGGALTNGNAYLQATRWDGTATNYNMLLNPNGGNVGIGTTAPVWGIQTGNFRGSASAPVFSGTSGDGFAFDYYNGPNPYPRHGSIAVMGAATATADMSFWTDSGSAVAERMRITSAGNVGIGTANPGAKLHVQTATDNGIVVNDGTVNGLIYVSSTLTKSFAIGTNTNHPMIFGTNSSFPQMMLATSGDVLIGGTALPTGSTSMMAWDNTNKWIRISKATAAYTGHVTFYNSNGAVGNITTDGSATAYNTSSDYRLKENVVPMSDALQRISKLKPSRFNFISDDKKIVDGFIAHEVQAVVPEAISGEKDAMRDEEYEVTPAVLDDDGKEVTPAVMGTRSVPEYQGIDQSKLVPLLVGALQELAARLEALENN
jgi:hypothetical protein